MHRLPRVGRSGRVGKTPPRGRSGPCRVWREDAPVGSYLGRAGRGILTRTPANLARRRSRPMSDPTRDHSPHPTPTPDAPVTPGAGDRTAEPGCSSPSTVTPIGLPGYELLA